MIHKYKYKYLFAILLILKNLNKSSSITLIFLFKLYLYIDNSFVYILISLLNSNKSYNSALSKKVIIFVYNIPKNLKYLLLLLLLSLALPNILTKSSFINIINFLSNLGCLNNKVPIINSLFSNKINCLLLSENNIFAVSIMFVIL